MSNRTEQIAASRTYREHLLRDPHRPTYHFTAPEGHCYPFDPNGAVYWNGRYHLFYIFQDEGRHCWGHASSTDLLHWTHHPTALAPQPGDCDTGIFSGSAFQRRDGTPGLIYHGVDAGNCIAISQDDDLNQWNKLPTNPIVPSPKEGDAEYGQYRSWDPHGWLENDTYYAIFGGDKPTLFTSKDLTHWDFQGPFMSNELDHVIDDDEDCSCPDFFPLGNKHMLLCISHKRGCRYYLGHWDGTLFTPETHGRMNWSGGTLFAPESLVDDQGRRIFWSWVLDRRPSEMSQASGWSGTMSLPRVLSLDTQGRLQIEPAGELAQLRTQQRTYEDLSIIDQDVPLPSIQGDRLELDLVLYPEDAEEFGVNVRISPDRQEHTMITYNPRQQTLSIDLQHSSLDDSIKHYQYCMYQDNPVVNRQEAPLALDAGEPLHLRIFLDRSILEVFANKRQCLTQRVYPSRSDSLGVHLFSRGGRVHCASVHAWNMAPANPY